MDNLTHTLFGLTLARTPLSRVGRGTTAAILLASNAPDIDVGVTFWGAGKYLEFHRGPTHGPLGVVGLAAVVAALVWFGHKRWDRGHTDPPATFAMLWAVSMLGVAGHIVMDLPTSYGVRSLSPFTWAWFGIDWMPIVDVYLLAILGGGLWFGRGGKDDSGRAVRRRRSATIALVLMAVNYGVRAAAHHTAVGRAPAVFGGLLPEWCDQSVRPSWSLDRWPPFPGASPREAGASRCLVELAAIPDFLSPFRWRMIAQMSSGYEMRDVDLLSGAGLSESEALATRVLSVHIPNQWTPAVVRASMTPIARVFLGFSRFPAARSVVEEDGTATVKWTDLRFFTGALDDPRQFRRGLFSATVVIGPDGRAREARQGP